MFTKALICLALAYLSFANSLLSTKYATEIDVKIDSMKRNSYKTTSLRCSFQDPTDTSEFAPRMFSLEYQKVGFRKAVLKNHIKAAYIPIDLESDATMAVMEVRSKDFFSVAYLVDRFIDEIEIGMIPGEIIVGLSRETHEACLFLVNFRFTSDTIALKRQCHDGVQKLCERFQTA